MIGIKLKHIPGWHALFVSLLWSHQILFGILVCPKIGKTYSKDNSWKWADNSQLFGFPKNLCWFGFFRIYCKYNPRQCLLMVNNHYNIQKSCLEQQRIGLPSCKTRTVHLLCYFGTAILEIFASDMQLQIKPASSSSIFCQHVVHTTLWYKHMSKVKQNYELYCQELVSFADLPLCFCKCWLNMYMLKKIRER